MVIKGKPVNREGGIGLQVPCEYIFDGDDLKTATVNLISTVRCSNQGTMTKVKKSVVRYRCVVAVTVAIV